MMAYVDMNLPPIAFYQIYFGQSLNQVRSLHAFAAKNSQIALGLDTNYNPPCLYDHNRSSLEQILFVRDYILSYIKWYLSNLSSGRLILPISLIVNILDWISPVCPPLPFDSTCMSYFFKGSDDRYSAELMATYVRHISEINEEYGVKPYHIKTMQRFVFRTRIYQRLLSALFLLRPKLYVTWQATYLQFYLPCYFATRHFIPVAYLGSADNSLLKLSSTEVCRDWDWMPCSSPIKPSKQWHIDRSKHHQEAKSRMVSRLYENKIDSLISYMPLNPYQITDKNISSPFLSQFHSSNINLLSLENFNYPEGFVCVFMHEFNDYHYNGVLPSFASSYYEWLLITCKILFASHTPFVVKLHPVLLSDPDQEKYSRSLQALSLLANHFTQPLPVVDSMNTLELVQHGLVLGCTVRGTVATELVFLRRPVVCAGQPPYMNFIPSRIFNRLVQYENALTHYLSHREISDDEFNSCLDYLSLSAEAKISNKYAYKADQYIQNMHLCLDSLVE